MTASKVGCVTVLFICFQQKRKMSEKRQLAANTKKAESTEQTREKEDTHKKWESILKKGIKMLRRSRFSGITLLKDGQWQSRGEGHVSGKGVAEGQ